MIFLNNLRTIVVVVLTIFTSLSLKAEELSHFSVQGGGFQTSDNLAVQYYQVLYRNHRRSLSYPYKNSQDEAFDYGIKLRHTKGELNHFGFAASEIGFSVGRKFSNNFKIEGGLDGQNFSNQNYSNNLLSPNFNIEFVSEKKFIFNFNVSRSFMVEEGYIPGPVENGIHFWKIKPYSTYYILEDLRFILRPDISFTSDDNTRVYSDSALMYAVSVWPAWFWVGIGAEYLINSKTANYWSPKTFYSYGIRLELERHIFSEFSGFVGLNLNKLNEDDFDEGNGHYLSAGVSYGDRNLQNFRMEFSDIQSVQSSNKWQSTGLSLKWNIFF